MSTLPNVGTTGLANIVDNSTIMDNGIRPLIDGTPRITGRAFIAQCGPGDNLMMHAAIYRAQPGDIIVCHSGGTDPAVAGGNVCAVAQQRGIAGFVIDGNIRDVDEIRDMGLPVFARGLYPKPGSKKALVPAETVTVGGVEVRTGDIVVADEDGIVVVAAADAEQVFAKAAEKERAESEAGLAAWTADHRAKVLAALEAGGDFEGLPE
ncbi:4-hydroxy-4-methyl-2-oxoglutarate aldolase [Corynebacterium kalinowskii]|uniref:Putative 4-hydroxy-4-methyl-2-oxoglutarate aldolase n=1 Tax=Corynebacterium kalinowskii TaxID=2675216 RepID=A0A6B8VEE0_9CORY|nr:RraA family protein [Corynebacterium kalinowskii]QGU01429.1 4-hydroxy-4-methyl-2-oxoglutarate aldolase [Corynebacterium kalinowskii]